MGSRRREPSGESPLDFFSIARFVGGKFELERLVSISPEGSRPIRFHVPV